MRRIVRALAVLALAAALPAPLRAETDAERDARMAWFRDAKLGIFIHWGLYSQLAGEWKDRTTLNAAEWIQSVLSIPSSEYEPLARTWNPSKYDPRAWVRRMKAAGARYVCITTKHHDGFCLWPTQHNRDWNVAATPHGRDLLEPLAQACREEGVRFCVYYSVLDWHHPDWPVRPDFNDVARGAPDKARYERDYLYPQIGELFARYGEIGMLWLDGTWDGAWTSEDGAELEAYVRKLQPSVILNNRSGYKPPQPEYGFQVANAYGYVFAGDYISPEGEVPPKGLPGITWETCQTMQLPNNWGYNRLVGFRSYVDLLRQLVDVASKGGNLLLNVGPTAEGEIPHQAGQCLDKLASWMAVNAEAIHGTSATPFERLPFRGRCTRKGQTLYLHVFDWPASGSLLVPMRNAVKRAYLLADPARTPLATTSSAAGSVISAPAQPPDLVVSVVAVEIEGEPDALPPPRDLAAGRPVKVSSVWAGRPELAQEHVTDSDPTSMWATEEKAREGWVEVELAQEANVGAVVLCDAPYGRIRAFEVQVERDGAWRTVASGTTIGAQASLDFAPARTRRVRVLVLKAVDTPTLADLQVLGAP